MASHFGRRITDAREKAVLIAYQDCLDREADRFIIQDTASPDQLEAALHLLLTDVCDRAVYRIRYAVRSGVVLVFEDRSRSRRGKVIGEWNGNRKHGVVRVDAIKDIRDRYRQGA